MILGGENPLRGWLEHQIGCELADPLIVIANIAPKGFAVAGFNNWTGEDIELHIAGVGRWVTRGFLAELAHHAYTTCGCDRATVRIRRDNARAIKAAERAGFRHEGTIRTAAGGILIYGLLKEECRYGTTESEGDAALCAVAATAG